MRRRSRSNIPGNLDISPGTSVETRRQSADSFASVVVWPFVQSLLVGGCTFAAIASVLVAPAIIGARAFWFGCFIVALGSLLYAIRYETDALTMFSWPLLAGVIFWCLWAFSDGLFHIPQSPWLSLLGVGLVVFWCTVAVWVWVSLGQRLIQQSLHQERYGWEVLAGLLEWVVKKPRPPLDPPIAHTGRPTVPEDTSPLEKIPLEKMRIEQMFIALAGQYGTLARDDSKNGQGLRGKILMDGSTLSKTDWDDCIAWLTQYKYIEKRATGNEWINGWDAQSAYDSFAQSVEE